MFKVRLMFEKTGPAAYLSHLDLMKCFQRAFRRAHLPVRYSQGFNPHIYLSILAPLSTGFESRGDLCDFDLLEAMDFDAVVAALNTTLPPGISALRAGPPQKKPGAIAWSRYRIEYPQGEAAALAERLEAGLRVTKKSKRSSREIELAAYIQEIAFVQQGAGAVCQAVLKAGDDPLNPVYITRGLQEAGLLEGDCAPLYIREAILDDSHQIFF